MTRLFQELAGSKMQTQRPASNSPQNGFIQQAAQQGFRLTVPDFIRFAKMADGKDMNGLLRELRETGQMDEKKYNYLREQAQGFMGLLKRFI